MTEDKMMILPSITLTFRDFNRKKAWLLNIFYTFACGNINYQVKI